jgi:hypothetical protein
MDSHKIRERIRTLLGTNELPCDEPAETWAGRGGGARCVACGEPIAATEIEFEVTLPSVGRLLLHRLCHAIWLEECHGAAPPAPGVIDRA